MTIGILATGDELIHGDTLNTNAKNIAHALAAEGLSLSMQLACGDKEQEIITALDFLCHHHTIIVVIGGLGPTSDDRTRFALARYLKISLVEFPQALHHIQNRLSRAGLPINEGNLQQTLFPAEAVLLANPNGTAMGCCYQHVKHLFILLPGPPRECLPMLNQQVLPYLHSIKRSEKIMLKWRLFGVAEGQIAEKLEKALQSVACETGYRLDTPYLEFKIRTSPIEVSRIQKIIQPLIESYIIATPEQRASELLCETLVKHALPVTIIDKATGGRLQTLLQNPATYPFLSFHEQYKSLIYFHISGLNEYWKQTNQTTATLLIRYRYKNKSGYERHQIPFYSSLVIEYAVEWLSFRLLHIINQLH